MKIDVYATQNSVHEKDLKDKTVVVVDVLRATSTIITALYNGCKEIIPVNETEEAVNIAKNYEKNAFLLGGERNSQKIEGFHLSNSPSEYISSLVEGRTVLITTTNGTRAIKKAGDANNVVIAGFINVDAVCEYVGSLNEDVTFICAGTEGKFSLDDIIAVGAIISGLEDRNANMELDDLALVCKYMYENNKNDIEKALENTYHYRNLIEKGFSQDIKDCLRLNSAPIIGIYRDGVIRRLENVRK